MIRYSTMIDDLKKPADIDDTPKVRRSARFSKTESPVKERKESPVKEISVPKLHKARNAPWEDPNFPNRAKYHPIQLSFNLVQMIISLRKVCIQRPSSVAMFLPLMPPKYSKHRHNVNTLYRRLK